MNGIIKSMIIRELIENEEIVGYNFRKKMSNMGIKVSNGSIYLHLKNFEKLGYLKTHVDGKKKVYILTKLGQSELTKKLKSIPKEIEMLMQEAGSQIPFIDWLMIKDVDNFLSTLKTLIKLVERHREQL